MDKEQKRKIKNLWKKVYNIMLYGNKKLYR